MSINTQISEQLTEWISTRSDRHHEHAIQELVISHFAKLGKSPLEVPTLTRFETTDIIFDVVEAQRSHVTAVPNLVFPAAPGTELRVMVMFNADTSPVDESLLESQDTVRVSSDGTAVHGWGGLKSNSVATLHAIASFVDDIGEYPSWLEVASVVEEELTGHGAISVLEARPTPDVAFVTSPLGAVNCGGHCGVARVGITLDSRVPLGEDRDRVMELINEFLETQAPKYQSSFATGIESAGIRVLPSDGDSELVVRIGLPFGVEPQEFTEQLHQYLRYAIKNQIVAVHTSGLFGRGFSTAQTWSADFTHAWSEATGRDVPTRPFLAAGDARHFDRRNVSVTSFGNQVQNLHTAEEYVNVEDVITASEVLRAKFHELHQHILDRRAS